MLRTLTAVTLVVVLFAQQILAGAPQESQRLVDSATLVRDDSPVRVRLVFTIRADRPVAELRLHYKGSGAFASRVAVAKRSIDGNFHFEIDYYPSMTYFIEVVPESGPITPLPGQEVTETLTPESFVREPYLARRGWWSAIGTVGQLIVIGLLTAATAGIVTKK